MEDRLLTYYERELTFIRDMGAEFARKYPKIAGRLLLEEGKCEDPHTERLIEAFAFLSGRIHKKIDDDFPEITESLLSIIYPHYINPIPSMSIVMFDPIAQNIPPAGYTIESGSALYSKPVSGTPCQFSTTQPVTIWPVAVTSAGLEDPKRLKKGAQQAIFIRLKSFNQTGLDTLDWQTLRFFLSGPSQHIFHLYEIIFNQACHVECEATTDQGGTTVIDLGDDAILPVGFGPQEATLPLTQRSFPGYLILLEYFCFPEKFLYFDLSGLDKLRKQPLSDEMTIRIYLNRRAKANLLIDRGTFRLNTTPAVNLFKRIAEPIRVDQQKTEYRVVPDVRRQEAMEVFTVDGVTATTSNRPGEVFEYKPFYSIRHHLGGEDFDGHRAYWHLQRRSSGRKDDQGTEIFLSFSDLDLTPMDPGVDILTLHTTCLNRDLPTRLPFGDAQGDFDLETAAPVARIICLVKPTPVRRPARGGALQWRLISHLSLNYLSIVNEGETALREILKLYDFDDSPATRQQIIGIQSVDLKHVTRRIGRSFCRGVGVSITFDEEKYVGTGVYLFASVLERFLAQYASVNSFSQLTAKAVQRKEVIRQWAPRSGHRILL
jgi:type VI secretion system protein ImpG